MFVRCFNCHTALQLREGATTINCTICHAVRDLRVKPSSSSNSYDIDSYPSPAALPPYDRSPPRPSSPDHGRKKAVICGILYENSKHKLEGCINDAKSIKSLLIKKFKFPKSSIIMLTEKETNPNQHPTKQNIRRALHWLIKDCENGDSLVFYYSGHGSQVKDYSRDEVDGYDETIWPLDYEKQGMIFDNEINATIVRPLPMGAILHVIIDSCSSGTILDLPYLYKTKRQGKTVWKNHSPPSGILKETSGGKVFCFSGCDDDQSSHEIKKRRFLMSIKRGDMTSCFVDAINKCGEGITYGTILDYMRTNIDSGGPGTSRSATNNPQECNKGGKIKQVPQLASSIEFDVDTPFSL